MRNVVVICLDTVRKDFFDSNNDPIKPLIDIDVQQCRSTSAWSTPSHAGMLTGKLAHSHGVHTYQRSFRNLSTDDTFISNLNNHTILGASANIYAGYHFGFDEFFDKFAQLSAPSQRYIDGLNPAEYNDGKPILDYIHFLLDSVNSDHPIGSIANGVAGLMRNMSKLLSIPGLFDDGAKPVLNSAEDMVQNTKEPFFLFINLMDAHLPLRPHLHLKNHDVPPTWSTEDYNQWDIIYNEEALTKYWEHRENLYASTINYQSRRLFHFIKNIREISTLPVSFIITSDHGENLGRSEEDGFANHTSSLSEGLLHVPLSIINPPMSFNNPREKIVSHLNFPEIVLSVANENEPTWDSPPRAEVIGMGPNPDPPSDQEFWDRSIRCSYVNETKYVWDSQGNKYSREIRLSKPNWQGKKNKINSIPSELKKIFDSSIDSAVRKETTDSADSKLEQSAKDRLEQLGYI